MRLIDGDALMNEANSAGAYGYVDGEVSRNERKKTNADRIRSMTDEELAEFIRSMVDGSYNYDFACYKYTNCVTHHSDPANKGIYLYKCDDCESEGIGLDVLMWLQQPAEVNE